MNKAIYYHAGCHVCVEAENQVLAAIDRSKYSIEVVDLGVEKNRVTEAEQAGVKSVPALVLNNTPFHINFGADLDVLK